MMPPRAFPIGFNTEEYRSLLEHKKAAIEKLCNAAREFLTCEIDATLEGMANPEPTSSLISSAPAGWPMPALPKVTADDLMEAQQRVEAIQSRVDEMQEAIDTAPIHEMAVLLKTVMIPTIQQELGSATQWRDSLQRRMEQQDSENSK